MTSMVRDYVARCFSTYNWPQEWKMKVRAYDVKDATFQVELVLERMSKRYGNEVHLLMEIGPAESEEGNGHNR
jgi:hypothetical protein